jgi:hypothetical protein
MAQAGEYLLSKWEALSSNLNTAPKKKTEIGTESLSQLEFGVGRGGPGKPRSDLQVL